MRQMRIQPNAVGYLLGARNFSPTSGRGRLIESCILVKAGALFLH